ncbi:hypothetical protein J6590_076691 [Homalodisca vitripennis]|nr:hypothetical protein J6590_076691 [Homalodisca vitripennis]
METDIFTIRQLFIRTVLVYTYSHKYAVLTPIVHSYPTRNAVSVGLQVPLIKLSINLTNAYYIANTLYRHLPSVIRDLQDEPVSGFKRLVTAWLRMIGPDGAEALLIPTYPVTFRTHFSSQTSILHTSRDQKIGFKPPQGHSPNTVALKLPDQNIKVDTIERLRQVAKTPMVYLARAHCTLQYLRKGW